jgi:hypothetical protein
VAFAPPPVELSAEDDHVRHHVEPEQEDRGPAERPQRDVYVGETHEERQYLKRRLEHERTEDGAGQRFLPVHDGVRQPVVDDEEEEEHAEQGNNDRDDVGESRAAGERAEVVLQEVHPQHSDHEADEERGQDARRQRGRDPLAVQEASVGQPVDDVECRLERAEQRE